MSFFSGFFNLDATSGEHQVLCPFPHKTGPNGLQYFENTPSAHVNMEKHLFHCKACGTGVNEKQFIQKVLGCTPASAAKILKACETTETLYTWSQNKLLPETRLLAHSLGISDDVLEELNIKSVLNKPLALEFPVLLYDQVVDIRTYTPGGHPKCKSKPEGVAGLIIPFDIWQTTPPHRVTIICAGEKDMAVARSNGLNAITITGGEMMQPRILEPFRDRSIAICYDNDETGIAGAQELAQTLSQVTNKIRIVTGFHEVCQEPKEDITDFFQKYHKTREDLIQYIQATEYFIPQYSHETNTEIVTLAEASQPKYRNKLLQSNIQIVAVTDTVFTAPASVTAEKVRGTAKDNLLIGEVRDWELTDNNPEDILYLIDNGFTEAQVKQHLETLMHIPEKEKGLHWIIHSTKTIFKAVVTDLFETNSTNTTTQEYLAYSISNRLESGQKYSVTYKLVPDPNNGQRLVMIVLSVATANDSVSNFIVTPQVKENLRSVQELPGNVAEKIHTLTEKVKGLLGYNGNNTLIQTIDLSFHTALQFNLGNFTNIRGYLDTIVVGESRVGKSSTAECLRQEYGLGVFTSLAGNSATIPGLIGGSNKTAAGFQTRAGVIPQNNRGLIIFEEFGKCKQDVVTELTDIRSSGEVRIARVSGTITLPALVRMIALTNTKAAGGAIKPIASYPNGISIITELVGTAEDIARYDLIVILADRGNSQIDPYWEPQEPLPTAVYQDRIRWIWSRTPEQIQIPKEVGLYIMDRANALNAEFDCHIKIFGTEAWKKLTRLAIAVAGYVVSTDENYEFIYVTKEHVDFAEQFFRHIYDNPTFKLREYVQNERQYRQIDDDGMSALQDIYNKWPALIQQLERSAVASKNMLSSASGLPQDELNKALSRLTKALFIQYQGYDIVPTERFRLGAAYLNKATQPTKLGEAL